LLLLLLLIVLLSARGLRISSDICENRDEISTVGPACDLVTDEGLALPALEGDTHEEIGCLIHGHLHVGEREIFLRLADLCHDAVDQTFDVAAHTCIIGHGAQNIKRNHRKISR